MSKICHAHCPDDSGALLAAVLAVILTAVLAVIAAQVIESLFVVIVAIGSVLIAAGTGLFVWLVRRDRTSPPARAPAITGRVVQIAAARPAQAISAPRPRAIEAMPIRLASPAEEVKVTARARTGPQ